MSATPKLSFRANAETVAAIADVQALLAARRGGKPVSQAGAIDYAVRRAAEDLRAEPEHRLSPDDVQMVQGAGREGRLARRVGYRDVEGRFRLGGCCEAAARVRQLARASASPCPRLQRGDTRTGPSCSAAAGRVICFHTMRAAEVIWF